MGCDIHFYVERQRADGRWERAEEMVPNPYYHVTHHTQEERIRENWFDQRNYAIFAILADVRNEYREDRIPPIASPRGLPPDVSNEVRADSDGWDVDGHSHSWFTIRELLAVDWDQRDYGYPYEVVSKKWLNTLLRMARLAVEQADGDLTRVRCVFWFDN